MTINHLKSADMRATASDEGSNIAGIEEVLQKALHVFQLLHEVAAYTSHIMA